MYYFERGRDPKEVLNVGRGPGAFLVREVTLKMVVWQEGPSGDPNLGRYFRNDMEREFDLPLPKAYVLLSMVLKKNKEDLRKVFRSLLKDLDFRYDAHFTFFFKGDVGASMPVNGVMTSYHWSDLAGLDLIVDNKMVAIPKGRLLPDTDFQFHLSGELYPAKPKKINDDEL